MPPSGPGWWKINSCDEDVAGGEAEEEGGPMGREGRVRIQWVESQMQGSFCVIVTQERGRRRKDGVTLLWRKQLI